MPTSSPTIQDPPSAPASSPQMSTPIQRAGGIGALVEAATYVIGFGVMAAYLAPRGFLDAQNSPAESLTFLLDNQVSMYLWYLLIYLVAGAALVVLTLGVHDRLTRSAPALAQVSTAFGLIWSGLVLASGMIALVGQRAVVDLAATDQAEAISTWSSVSTVQDALGGGIELVGALWILLLSVTAIRTGALSRGLSILGIAIGVAGMWTLVPQVEDAASLFGLGFIVWYVWAGRTLLRA